jgi:hypothetical protein
MGRFYTVMTLMLLVLFVDVFILNKLDSIETAIKTEVQYCVWKHENHKTSVIKGTKTADKFRRLIGRPSDEGDCK